MSDDALLESKDPVWFIGPGAFGVRWEAGGRVVGHTILKFSGATGNLAPASVVSHISPKPGEIPEFPVRFPG